MDTEALIAVKKALKLEEKNNTDKAKKLFKHALNLSPNNHEVLLKYGEFLESCKDIVNADHFYLKAIRIKPKCSTALSHRKRTLPIVNQFDFKELKRIESKKDKLTLNWFENKEIYFQHIYHNVAIEGNTMSFDETKKVVETKLPIPGKSILEYQEILGFDSALRYLNESLANNNSDINIGNILEIHRRVMEYANPSIAGSFRKNPVFVAGHIPPPVSDIERLMDKLVIMLKFTTMHPIHIAAFAHHMLVFIHPFHDGNGRTSRLLSNLIFIKYGYPPIIIRKQQKCQYFELLQIANESDHRLFYRFISRIVEQTIDAFSQEHLNK